MITRKAQNRECECCGTTPHPDNWAISTSIKVHGRTVEPGTVLSFKREHGTFKFIRHVLNVTTGAMWVDCIGGTGQNHPTTAVTMFRSFLSETIRTVHNPPKARR